MCHWKASQNMGWMEGRWLAGIDGCGGGDAYDKVNFEVGLASWSEGVDSAVLLLVLDVFFAGC